MADRSDSVEQQIEHDYVLERLEEIRGLVADLLESDEFGRLIFVPDGGASALEAIARACYAAEQVWTR